MAGYKQTSLDLDPKLFITFDGDQFDRNTRTLEANPEIILDESGEGNHAIFHNETNAYLGYRMGMESLVELEQSNQYSMSFGYYGTYPAYSSLYPKTYLEVPHNSSFEFPESGSFSVSLMLERESTEYRFRDYYYSETGSPLTATLERPIIHKPGVMEMSYIDPWSGNSSIRVRIPGQSLTGLDDVIQYDVGNWFYGEQQHIVFVWACGYNGDASRYEASATLYMNGRVVGRKSYIYADIHPITNVASPWYIGGSLATVNRHYNDRNTSNVKMDQIAVYAKALGHSQVCRMFKKSRTYERVVKARFPNHYWIMDDIESTVSTTMVDSVGDKNGNYQGGQSRVQRQKSGPPLIPGSLAPKFLNGGTAQIHHPYSNAPVWDPGADYTIDFWFKTDESERGVLFSQQDDDYPYKGMLCQINRGGNQYSNGAVQFNVDEETYVSTRNLQDNNSTPFFFNDDRWHHCALVRRGETIELWLDGVRHDTAATPIHRLGSPGQIYLMSMMPGKLNCRGQMCHLNLTASALSPAEIQMRHAYSILYRVYGKVTLQGVPYAADIRVYNHQTGELIQTVESDSNDGLYMIHLSNNSFIDLTILNKEDQNVRYRSYGPIFPAEFEDLPVT